jgi:quercetin 2,3-dioxygenase
MLTLRKSQERGYADHGWLKSYHSFSFAGYQDPAHMGYGPLRVINEDQVQPGMGFGTHGHRDMEIITYVLEGALAHKDSMGNGSVIRPGDVQRISAGTGIMHSEFNHSKDQEVHFLQIWIEPNVTGIEPSYEEKHFDASSKQASARLVASPDGREGSVTIHQDAYLYASLLDGVQTLSHTLSPGRRAYVYVARGCVSVNGEPLQTGDAAAIDAANAVRLTEASGAELLLFDLP